MPPFISAVFFALPCSFANLWCRCHGIIGKVLPLHPVHPVIFWRRFPMSSFGVGNVVLSAHTIVKEGCSGSIAGLTCRSSGPNRHWQVSSFQRSDFSSPPIFRLAVGPVNFFR